MEGLVLSHIPGHALHEKGLKRQGVGTLVSSQERKATVVPVIHKPVIGRGSTAGFVPHRFT